MFYNKQASTFLGNVNFKSGTNKLSVMAGRVSLPMPPHAPSHEDMKHRRGTHTKQRVETDTPS